MKKLLSSLAMLLCFAMATNAQTINETLTAVGAPERLEATEVNDSTVLLTWTPVTGALGYGIMVYGKPLGLVSSADTTAYATVVPEVEYCFTIVTILQIDDQNYPTEWSEPSEAACITTGGLALEELASSFSIYPNPVKDELFLATELRVESVAIYDIYGRQTTVYGLQSTDYGLQTTVNVAELNSGVYFVKVVTSEGEIVKRFVKK